MLCDGFQFSQSSLQDFVECRQRFKLRYIEHLAWPALESEPYMQFEHLADLGARYHRLIHQYFLGIDPDRLFEGLMDENLKIWWQNFLAFAQKQFNIEDESEMVTQPEKVLAVSISKHTLVAKYDLLCISGGRLQIYDWKTTQKRPYRPWLAARIQTLLYPYICFQSASEGLIPDSIVEDLEMTYWFANYPDLPEKFIYDKDKFQADATSLTEMIALIERLEEDDFALTDDIKKCRYCVYRSYCDRGETADKIQDYIDAGEIGVGGDFDNWVIDTEQV